MDADFFRLPDPDEQVLTLSFSEQLKAQLLRLELVDRQATAHDYTTALTRLYAATEGRTISSVWGGLDRLLQSTSTPRIDTFFSLLKTLGGYAFIDWTDSNQAIDRYRITSRIELWQTVNQRIALRHEDSSWVPQLARSLASTSKQVMSIQTQLYRLLLPKGQTNRTFALLLPLIASLSGTLKIAWIRQVSYQLQIQPATLENFQRDSTRQCDNLNHSRTVWSPPPSQLDTVVYALSL